MKTYEGIYRSSFENSSFRPCNSDENWWLNAETTEVFDQVNGEEEFSTASIIGPRYLVVGARVSSDAEASAAREALGNSGMGGFGHLGMFDRDILVTKVLVSRNATEDEQNSCT